MQMLDQRDKALEDHLSHMAPFLFSFSGTPAVNSQSPPFPPSHDTENYSQLRIVATTAPGVGGLVTQILLNGALFDTQTLPAGSTNSLLALTTPLAVTPDDVVALKVTAVNGAVDPVWRFLT
jgi:hypothetical protein